MLENARSQSLLCRSALTLVAIGQGDLELAKKLSFEALKQARLHGNAVFEALLSWTMLLLLEARGEFVSRRSPAPAGTGGKRSSGTAKDPQLARLQLRLARLQLRQGRPREAAAVVCQWLEQALNCGDPCAFFTVISAWLSQPWGR